MFCSLAFASTINDEDCDLQGPSLVASWLTDCPLWAAQTVASQQANTARLRAGGMSMSRFWIEKARRKRQKNVCVFNS